MINQSKVYSNLVPSPDFLREGIVGRETTKPLYTSGFQLICASSRPIKAFPALNYCLYYTYVPSPRPSIIERQSGETALSYKRLGHRTSLEGNCWKDRGTIQDFGTLQLVQDSTIRRSQSKSKELKYLITNPP